MTLETYQPYNLHDESNAIEATLCPSDIAFAMQILLRLLNNKSKRTSESILLAQYAKNPRIIPLLVAVGHSSLRKRAQNDANFNQPLCTPTDLPVQ
jgi:hypothetical protein